MKNFCFIFFEGKIRYELKINYITPKLEGCTVYYLCVLVYWSCSRSLGFSWLCWVLKVWLEATVYHAYMDDWSPSVGDEFKLEIEELNKHDRYTVGIKVSDDTVGHVPRKLSKIVYYLKQGYIIMHHSYLAIRLSFRFPCCWNKKEMANWKRVSI